MVKVDPFATESLFNLEPLFKINNWLFSIIEIGVSIYGKQFDDEIHADLKHTGNYLNYNILCVIRLGT